MECYCQKKKKQNHTTGGATLLCSILKKKKTETPEKCSGEFEQHDNETSHLFFLKKKKAIQTACSTD